MHQPMPSERVDLQEAAQAFARLRHTKPTRRGRVTQDLWHVACGVGNVHQDQAFTTAPTA